MVEATPSRPYTGYTDDLLRVERNMRLRRKRLLSVLRPHEIAPSVSTFPLLGAVEHMEQQTVPETKVGGDIAESKVRAGKHIRSIVTTTISCVPTYYNS
jgi:glutamate--cysteine ligase catalytic subunit